ncbi:ATP-binding cassette domain-containing protein [Paraglaciecola aquimarina]|uniref:ATP-binding cassette domain-containing protein n=1 Tax=Paraglaciecola aquimarina TaxID=1235557 RepID=A0ABU3SZA2_9ALTE|nr:ATP-binding cassette domain-containing protein [Paraglaciecola aquimarina]MDU0355336.1 ATP-binding cassette domain-containing protein [Paraglaciecola aquimarina]
MLRATKKLTEDFAWVSVEQQLALIEAVKIKECADILDIIPVPTSVEDILFGSIDPTALAPSLRDEVYDIFSLSALLARPFRVLSTGETRKVLLAKAIFQQPKLMILDEPWDGLDSQAKARLANLFAQLSTSITFVFVLNRLSEVPDYCQQLILMDKGQISWQTTVNDNLALILAQVKQLQHLQQTTLTLPSRDSDSFAPRPLDETLPLVKLTNGKVQYGAHIVFQNLNWTILPQQHWQVTGPNGSGKTCLLNLITGDNPQCYVNDIFEFGFKRGSGESIWQIKQYIGYMSNAFHLGYTVNCSALHVVLSGYYDSVGLYQTPSSRQIALAKQWLTLMALEHQAQVPFQQMSFGDQRLVLIARAMVKHPTMLILDEPCNGLDDINRLKVLALIDLLAREGSTTLLYVNHHQEDVIPSIKHHLSMLDYKV